MGVRGTVHTGHSHLMRTDPPMLDPTEPRSVLCSTSVGTSPGTLVAPLESMSVPVFSQPWTWVARRDKKWLLLQRISLHASECNRWELCRARKTTESSKKVMCRWLRLRLKSPLTHQPSWTSPQPVSLASVVFAITNRTAPMGTPRSRSDGVTITLRARWHTWSRPCVAIQN